MVANAGMGLYGMYNRLGGGGGGGPTKPPPSKPNCADGYYDDGTQCIQNCEDGHTDTVDATGQGICLADPTCADGYTSTNDMCVPDPADCAGGYTNTGDMCQLNDDRFNWLVSTTNPATGEQNCVNHPSFPGTSACDLYNTNKWDPDGHNY